MSVAALSAQLVELAQARPCDGPARLRTLGACFHLLEHLTHPQNKSHLLAALLESDAFWDGEQDAFAVAYDVCAASSLLSLYAAEQLDAIARHLCNVQAVPVWRKAVLLASILSAELRDHDQPPAMYALWTGRSAGPCIAAMNQALSDPASSAQHAACLVAYSYIAEKLTSYQQSRLTSLSKLRLLESVLLSSLAWRDPASRGRKELGLMTRLLAQLIVQDSFRHQEDASACLLLFSKTIKPMPALAQKQAFLCVILLQQAVTRSFLLRTPPLDVSAKHRQDEVHATRCMQILQNLQNIHPDNAAFEPWRFIFGASLDLLSQDSASLQRYLGIMSSEERWRLLVLESAAPDLPVTSPFVLQGFTEALQGLSERHDEGLLELRHSVCLSLILSHADLLQPQIQPYLHRVFADWQAMTERQVRLILLSLYQLSLQQQRPNDDSLEAAQEEDRFGILRFIKDKQQTADQAQKKVLVLSDLDILPFVPIDYFARHLRSAAQQVQEVQDAACRQRLAEVCTTEMDSERAMAVARWRLGPEERSML